MSRAVVLLSGGMDSAVTASVAARDYDELYFLHAHYGQLTQNAEERAFKSLCTYFAPKDVCEMNLAHLAKFGGSALVDINLAVPQEGLSDGIPITYVPFRNGNLLAAGVAWAEALGATAVYIGVVEEDSSGYPDCRAEFIRAFEKAADLGTRPETRIAVKTPVIGMDKGRIVKLGLELGTPFEHTWSCYQSNDEACGVCDSCRLRLAAFDRAGVSDPIKYRARINLPENTGARE